MIKEEREKIKDKLYKYRNDKEILMKIAQELHKEFPENDRLMNCQNIFMQIEGVGCKLYLPDKFDTLIKISKIIDVATR